MPEIWRPEHGHDGNDGVLQAVLQDDRPLCEPLGPRRPHVVLTQHLEELGAGEPHDARGGGDGEDEGGDDELDEVLPGSGPKFRVVDQWAPPPPDGRKQHDERRLPEPGHREADDRQAPEHVVGGRVLARGGEHPDRQRDDDREDQREQPELQRDRAPAGAAPRGRAASSTAIRPGRPGRPGRPTRRTARGSAGRARASPAGRRGPCRRPSRRASAARHRPGSAAAG